MSGPVIIRLQNLPLEARSIDIRRFFDGLLIPDGGVHILGGEKGDAFIAFQTDEDARQAINRDGHYLCNTRIKLYLSSKNEMQNVIQAARNNEIIPPPMGMNIPKSQQQQQQPDLLSTLTKYMPTNITQATNTVMTTSTSTTSASNIFDHLKNMGQFNQNNKVPQTNLTPTPTTIAPSTTSTLPPVLADILTKASSAGNYVAPTAQSINTSVPPPQSFSNNSQYNQNQNGFYQQQQQPPVVSTPAPVAQQPIPQIGQLDITQLLSIIQSTLTPAQQTPTNVTEQPTKPTTNYSQPPQSSQLSPTRNNTKPYFNQQGQQNSYSYNNDNNDDSGQNGHGQSTSPQTDSSSYNKSYYNKHDDQQSSNNDEYSNGGGPQRHTNYRSNYNSDSTRPYPRFNNRDGNYRGRGGMGANNGDYHGHRDRDRESRDHREYRDYRQNRDDGGDGNSHAANKYNSRYGNNDNYQSSNSYDDKNDDSKMVESSSSSTSTREYLDPIIRVRNFNTNCSFKDIRSFLQGIQIEHNGIKLITDMSGNRTGAAHVKLVTITDLKKALCRNGQFYDQKAIEVVQSSEVEFKSISTPDSRTRDHQAPVQRHQRDEWSNQSYNNSSNNNNNNNNYNNERRQPYNSNINTTPVVNPVSSNTDVSGSGGYYLRIINLPPRFDKQQLQQEFNNVNFTNTQFVYNFEDRYGNRGTKLVCEMETKLDLEKALTKHNEKVGRGRLQITEMTRSEYENELMNTNKSGSTNDNYYPPYQGQQQMDDEVNNQEQGSGNNNNNYNNNENRFNNRNRDDQSFNRNRFPQSNRGGNSSRGGYMNRNTMNDERGNNGMFKRRMDPRNSSTSPYQGGNNNNNNSYDNTSDVKRVRQNDETPLSLPPELENYNSLVLLSNVAHKASREDIIDIIRPFNAIDDTLKIRHTDYGKPTGDAIVAFKNSNDAHNACKQLNGSMFIGRRLKATVYK